MGRKARRIGLSVLMTFMISSQVHAQTFVSGSTGVDGPLNPTQDVTLDLPPDGVFHLTTVNIPQGVTVRFNRNATNTPVFFLATEDITINGTIDVSGNSVAIGSPFGGEGGPGGFSGGNGSAISGHLGGAGLGPGGGKIGNDSALGGGGGGGFNSPGNGGSLSGTQTGSCRFNAGCAGDGGDSYGTEFLQPLIGGSGGAGGSTGSVLGTGGGGGGGAILIAASGTISIGNSGRVHANGGSGGNGVNLDWLSFSSGCGGGGSAGAIRLISKTIRGNGNGFSINPGAGGEGGICIATPRQGGRGGTGRLRIEFFNHELTTPITSVATVSRPGPVFTPEIPTLRIMSVGGVVAPAAPRGSQTNPDVTIPATATNPVEVQLAAANIPVGTIVTIKVIPSTGGTTTFHSTALSGSLPNSTASAQIDLPIGTGVAVVLMAQASFTVQQAGLDLATLDGEKFVKIQVGATLGGGSELTYITESGKVLPANEAGPLLFTRHLGSGAKNTSE